VTHIYKEGKRLVIEIKETAMPYGTVAIWHLGQSGVIIKGKASDGGLIIDPYLTYSIEKNNPESEFKRAFPPPVSPGDLEEISGVLVTHYHDDHLDVETISDMTTRSQETVVALPASHSHLLKNHVKAQAVRPIKDETSFYIKGFKMTPIPVAHTSYETDEQGHSLYYGYFIEVNGVRLFHSGDTIITDQLVETTRDFQPNIVFLPINGGDYSRTKRGIVGNMGFREAVDFAVEVRSDLILPIHYDLFPNNRDNPSYFVDYLFHHYPSQKFHMMVPGERFIYYK
jgi:L-ascorbate 6-phosphate lactonase